MDAFDGDPEQPPSLHKYLYCHADPVNKRDPSGHEVEMALAGLAIQGMLAQISAAPTVKAIPVVPVTMVVVFVEEDNGYEINRKIFARYINSKLIRHPNLALTIIYGSVPPKVPLGWCKLKGAPPTYTIHAHSSTKGNAPMLGASIADKAGAAGDVGWANRKRGECASWGDVVDQWYNVIDNAHVINERLRALNLAHEVIHCLGGKHVEPDDENMLMNSYLPNKWKEGRLPYLGAKTMDEIFEFLELK